MSRASLKRLERLEAERSPAGCAWVMIYARTRADYEAQRKALLAAGTVAETDWCLWDELPPDVDSMEPEIIAPSGLTHERWLDILLGEKAA